MPSKYEELSNTSRSPDYDDGDDDGQKKNPNRACDFCHRMKMKCIGKETPPCNRCRQAGQQCTFDGPRKSKTSKVEDRLKVVEAQMSGMQGALEELLRLQRANLPGGGSQRMNFEVPGFHQSPSDSIHTATPHGYIPIDPSLEGAGGMPPPPLPHLHPPHPMPYPPPRDMIYPQHPPNLPPPALWNGGQINPPPPPSSGPLRAPPPPPAPIRESEDGLADDDEQVDPLASGMVGPWDNMLSLAEAARLKQDGHLHIRGRAPSRSGPPGERKDGGAGLKFDYGESEAGRTAKRRRTIDVQGGNSLETDDFAEIKRSLPLRKGDQRQFFKDPIELGFCTEAKAREMCDLFFNGCFIYQPCFDPEVDTFDSLRDRSPFCLTTLIMVGAKIMDGSGAISPLQRQCREHAEQMGMSTLFTPIASIEVVQSLIILAAWGDTSWRPGGHASRVAMDMGLFRCLPMLSQTGMGKGKSTEELREEYDLVVGARVWLNLFKLEYENSNNRGQPITFAGEATLQYAREFLTHPLSIGSDSRLVAACEILSIRVPLHQPFVLMPNATSVPNFDEKLKVARDLTSQWLTFWTAYYERNGTPKDSILGNFLITMQCASDMYINSRILFGVRSKRDVANLSEQRKDCLLRATQAAETLLDMCLRGGVYAKNFRYANNFTHFNVAFTARFLIRMVSLIPESVNTKRIGKDVEMTANVLTQVPGFQLAKYLKEVITRARQQHVLPPLSKPPSPTSGVLNLPPLPQQQRSSELSLSNPNAANPAGALANGIPPLSTPNNATLDFSMFTPGDGGGHFDFSYAEELFNTGPAVGNQSISFFNEAPTEPINMTESSQHADRFIPWFFPPLESDVSPSLPVPTLDNSMSTAPGRTSQPADTLASWYRQ